MIFTANAVHVIPTGIMSCSNFARIARVSVTPVGLPDYVLKKNSERSNMNRKIIENAQAKVVEGVEGVLYKMFLSSMFKQI